MSAQEGIFPKLSYVPPQDCNEKYMVGICQTLKIQR